MDWMLMPLRRYADFTGRSRRKEYWMYILGFVILALPLAIVEAMAGLSGSVLDTYGPLTTLLILVLFIPSLAVQARRFHDQDKSGWLVLLNLVPFVGSIIVIVFMVLDGTPGPNRFGPDPKAGERGPVGYNGPTNDLGGPDRI